MIVDGCPPITDGVLDIAAFGKLLRSEVAIICAIPDAKTTVVMKIMCPDNMVTKAAIYPLVSQFREVTFMRPLTTRPSPRRIILDMFWILWGTNSKQGLFATSTALPNDNMNGDWNLTVSLISVL